jgi:hypothetical protein
MARGLWVNTAIPGNVTSDETPLLSCFGKLDSTTVIDAAMAQFNFVPVPTGITRNKTCPTTLP